MTLPAVFLGAGGRNHLKLLSLSADGDHLVKLGKALAYRLFGNPPPNSATSNQPSFYFRNLVEKGQRIEGGGSVEALKSNRLLGSPGHYRSLELEPISLSIPLAHRFAVGPH